MKSQGLGDTVARITKLLYIDKAVEKVAHAFGYEDCGCTRRKTLLNKLFPYTKKKK